MFENAPFNSCVLVRFGRISTASRRHAEYLEDHPNLRSRESAMASLRPLSRGTPSKWPFMASKWGLLSTY